MEREAASKGRLGIDATVEFGKGDFAFGDCQLELGFDLAPLLDGWGIASFGAQLCDVIFDCHRRLLN
jgi:hypothetical protein